MSRKLEEYNKYLIVNNIKPTLEIANAFYVAYAIGYANSSEDSYNNSQLSQDNLSLKQELESVKRELEKSRALIL